jgi:hypothetical protein
MTMTLRRFEKWLRQRIRQLTDWSKPLTAIPEGIERFETTESWPGPDPDCYADAAEIVQQAGEHALTLGLADLYEPTRTKGPIGFDEAKTLLARCLLAIDALVATPRKRRNTDEKMAFAIRLAENYPDLTKTQIAERVGVSRRTLNNRADFQMAWKKNHIKGDVRTGTKFSRTVDASVGQREAELQALIEDQAADDNTSYTRI